MNIRAAPTEGHTHCQGRGSPARPSRSSALPGLVEVDLPAVPAPLRTDTHSEDDQQLYEVKSMASLTDTRTQTETKKQKKSRRTRESRAPVASVFINEAGKKLKVLHFYRSQDYQIYHSPFIQKKQPSASCSAQGCRAGLTKFLPLCPNSYRFAFHSFPSTDLAAQSISLLSAVCVTRLRLLWADLRCPSASYFTQPSFFFLLLKYTQRTPLYSVLFTDHLLPAQRILTHRQAERGAPCCTRAWSPGGAGGFVARGAGAASNDACGSTHEGYHRPPPPYDERRPARPPPLPASVPAEAPLSPSSTDSSEEEEDDEGVEVEGTTMTIEPPTRHTGEVNGHPCRCPLCLFNSFVSFFFSNQRRASPHVMAAAPSPYLQGRPLPALPHIPDPGLDGVCPIFHTWGFCPHSIGCYLAHEPEVEDELHFGLRPPGHPTHPLRQPLLQRGTSAEEELQRLRAKAARHLDQCLWTCDVCGFEGITDQCCTSVGEVYFYRHCPNCYLMCYQPEVTYLLEHLLWECMDDYQLFKTRVEHYRRLVPDEFKVPLSSEAHTLSTTVYAWSLVSTKDIQDAVNAAYRVLPSMASVISIGSGIGYVEHLFNRVMNDADLPAFGPVVAWRKLAGEPGPFPSSISKDTAAFYGHRHVPVYAFDELVRRFEYSVHVSLGGPLSVLSTDCANSVLLLCWPPFGSPTEEQSSMGNEALEYFRQRGGRVLIFIGDVSSTGDWRFHDLRDRHYKLVREYPVRREVRRWYPPGDGAPLFLLGPQLSSSCNTNWASSSCRCPALKGGGGQRALHCTALRLASLSAVRLETHTHTHGNRHTLKYSSSCLLGAPAFCLLPLATYVSSLPLLLKPLALAGSLCACGAVDPRRIAKTKSEGAASCAPGLLLVMNELEYAVGATEDARSDVVRYVRQLRRLDERIEFHLCCMRLIAAERENSTSLGGASPSPSPGLTRGNEEEESEAKRARLELYEALQEAEEAVVPEWREEVAGHRAVPVGGETEAALYRLFTVHKTDMERHVKERETLSLELAKVGKHIHLVVANQLQAAALDSLRAAYATAAQGSPNFVLPNCDHLLLPLPPPLPLAHSLVGARPSVRPAGSRWAPLQRSPTRPSRFQYSEIFVHINSMPLQQVQQRLFTGGLFQEEVNDQLVDFARRHFLTSAVWVPVRCFDTVLRNYGVSMRPSASLLAVAAEKGTLGGSVLVNAGQTSHCFFLENFHYYMAPETNTRVHPHTHGGTAGSLYSAVPSSAMQRCSHPLTPHGEPLVHPATVELLTRLQQSKGYRSNYWTRAVPASVPRYSPRRLQGWFNVEEHPRAGRYNPLWCVHYEPHTLTNQPFPELLRRQMVERAVRYGYVSRLWLTCEEAARVFRGASLLPDCADHDPPIWCHQLSGGLQQHLYYCADQFTVSPSEVPRGQETNLAASGVDIGVAKLRAFPLLAAPPGQTADATEGSAARQERLARVRNAHREVQLFHPGPAHTAELEATLSRERFLRGWSSPLFLRSTAVLRYGLALRGDGQQGVLTDSREQLFHGDVSLQQECWINAAQLTEPALARELATHHPISAIWQFPLQGTIAANCARLQVLHRYKERQWILLQAVEVIPHWRLRPGARGVPFFNYEDASPAAPTDNAYPLVWYNLDEVEGISAPERLCMDHYAPTYANSIPVKVIALKVFMTLRALQAGFESPVWVELKPEQAASAYCPPAQQGPRSPRSGPTTAFALILPPDCTLVLYQGKTYMNYEDTSPLSLTQPAVRNLVGQCCATNLCYTPLLINNKSQKIGFYLDRPGSTPPRPHRPDRKKHPVVHVGSGNPKNRGRQRRQRWPTPEWALPDDGPERRERGHPPGRRDPGTSRRTTRWAWGRAPPSGTEDEEGEDLFGDDYMRDYLAPDEESESTAEDDVAPEDWIVNDSSDTGSEISERDRRAVDAMMERHAELDRQLQAKQREMEEGLFSDVETLFSDAEEEGDESDESDEEAEAGAAGSQGYTDPDAAAYVQGDLEGLHFNWRQPQGELVSWLAQELPRRAIKNRIYNFFVNYREGGTAVYESRIKAMIQENDMSFQLSYSHLSRVYDSVLALWLVDAPDAILELLEDAGNHYTFQLFPHYKKVQPHIAVRIADLPLCDPIRDFRQVHMNVLVRVEGVVVRRSPVYPRMHAAKYDCVRCSYIIGPIYQRGDREQRVSVCPSCQSKGPFRVNMMLTEFRNHQTLALQESPGKVPPGRLPRSLEVILTQDLIDRAKPGEEVDVTGIYRNHFDPLLNSRQGFPVFTTVLQANNVLRRTTELGTFRLPDYERQRVLEMSKHPNIKRKLLQSIAPSICGREDIKLGLLLAMLGGVPKDVGGDQSHRIRGDINVLMVGDPGCAKSQFLKFVEKTADRTVFTTGRGSTAVGLTASVHKDTVSGDFVLEGGALVIADRGCCLIDEFDKMSDQDRTSIHEAMEQQTISVARAGIVTSLSARCCILAAANPIGGRYDPSSSFDANVSLTSPILSRFDLLFVLRDEVNVELDTQLATFVCNSHIRNHPRSQQESRAAERELHERLTQTRLALESTADESERQRYELELQELRQRLDPKVLSEDTDISSSKPLPQALLRQYILYARSHCHPRVANIDANVIARLYTELRQESRHGGIAITVRHMESVIRLSEAHARLHLRDFVQDQDVTAAIALFLRCFIQTQKYSMRRTMEARFRRYLEAESEPLPLIQHRVRTAIAAARHFERQMSGGVEPTRVRVEVAEIERYTANVPAEALTAFFASEEFRASYTLIRDDVTQAPLYIEHSIV
eukprot:gene8333-5840_t